MKQNSQSRRGVRTPEQQALRKEFSRIRSYYKRSISDRTTRMMQSTMINGDEKRQITNSVKDIIMSLDMLFKQEQETEEMVADIKRRYRDIMKFFRRLEQEGWSVGRYIRKWGFHPDYLPEEKFYVGSVKIVEAITNIEDAMWRESFRGNLPK